MGVPGFGEAWLADSIRLAFLEPWLVGMALDSCRLAGMIISEERRDNVEYRFCSRYIQNTRPWSMNTENQVIEIILSLTTQYNLDDVDTEVVANLVCLSAP
jgi:hypothetical protein